METGSLKIALLPGIVLPALMSAMVAAQGPPAGTSPSNVRPSQGPGLPTFAAPPIDGVKVTEQGRYSVTDPRPLEIAAILLQRKLGVPISYEETAWVYAGDLVNASTLPGNEKLSGTGPLVPRLTKLDLTIPMTPSALATVAPETLAQQAIDSHRSYGNPGDFKVVRFGDGELSIVIDKATTKEGRLVAQNAPLDTRISFPEADRSLLDTLNLIVKGIAAKSQMQLLLGPSAPPRYFVEKKIRVGAQDEPARNVLARALRIPGNTKLSWHVTSAPASPTPSSSKDTPYFFVLMPVEVEVLVPGRGVQLQAVTWPK